MSSIHLPIVKQLKTNPIQTAESANLAPWFGPNLQRNVYLSLLHMDPEDGNQKSPRVPESVLKAALLRRAVEDIDRLIQIKSAKQACSSLLLRGSVGDDLWQRFQRAEKEMEEELRDVVTEVCILPSYKSSNVSLLHRDHFAKHQRHRQTPSHQTGVLQSSNPPTKSPPTPVSAHPSTKSKSKRPLKRHGGRSAAARSKLTS